MFVRLSVMLQKALLLMEIFILVVILSLCESITPTFVHKLKVTWYDMNWQFTTNNVKFSFFVMLPIIWWNIFYLMYVKYLMTYGHNCLYFYNILTFPNATQTSSLCIFCIHFSTNYYFYRRKHKINFLKHSLKVFVLDYKSV